MLELVDLVELHKQNRGHQARHLAERYGRVRGRSSSIQDKAKRSYLNNVWTRFRASGKELRDDIGEQRRVILRTKRLVCALNDLLSDREWVVAREWRFQRGKLVENASQ
jgi:hypothetical protein